MAEINKIRSLHDKILDGIDKAGQKFDCDSKTSFHDTFLSTGWSFMLGPYQIIPTNIHIHLTSEIYTLLASSDW